MDHHAAEVAPVAIVGGSGFIGRHLATCLAAAGTSVRIIDIASPMSPSDAEWVRCDIRDRRALRNALSGVRTLYNLAAARGPESHTRLTYRMTNVEAARNVCDEASQAGVERIVFTSTAAVYGRMDGPDERSPTHPTGDYGRSKLSAERVYQQWAAEEPARKLVIVRPTVVFGPGASGSGDLVIRRAVDPAFVHAGYAAHHKSLAFVENLAAFLCFLVDTSGSCETFNYCDLPDLTHEDIVSTLRCSLDLPAAGSISRVRAYAAALRERFSTRRGQHLARAQLRAGRERRFDATRAHATGFQQPVSLRDALARTVREDFGWLSLLPRTGP